MGKKITQLATITEVADDDLIVGVDVSDTSGSDNGTNKKFTKATLLAGLAPLGPQLTGWNPDAETWVYHNVDDPTGYIKIEDKDVSANYSVGWRIMFTNGGNVIKGIITAITFTDPDTIITFLHEIDPTDNQALYLLTNSAITENYFSPHKAPLGFPMSPAKWQVLVVDSTVWSQVSSGTTVYNPNGINIAVPIGSWSLTISVLPQIGNSSHMAGAKYMTLGLGSSNSTFNTNLSSSIAGADIKFVRQPIYRTLDLLLTSKTTFHLNARSDSGAGETLYFLNDSYTASIVAVCKYL